MRLSDANRTIACEFNSNLSLNFNLNSTFPDPCNVNVTRQCQQFKFKLKFKFECMIRLKALNRHRNPVGWRDKSTND